MTIEIDELKKVKLLPNDVIVVRYNGFVTKTKLYATYMGLHDSFPGHKIIVLDDSSSLEVFSICDNCTEARLKEEIMKAVAVPKEFINGDRK